MSDVSLSAPKSGTGKTLAYVAAALLYLFAPAGVAIAYIDRPKASPMIASHYSYMIGTFWKGLLFCAISLVLSFVLIGLITSFATMLWYTVRVAKSVVLLTRDEPIENPNAWLL